MSEDPFSRRNLLVNFGVGITGAVIGGVLSPLTDHWITERTQDRHLIKASISGFGDLLVPMMSAISGSALGTPSVEASPVKSPQPNERHSILTINLENQGDFAESNVIAVCEITPKSFNNDPTEAQARSLDHQLSGSNSVMAEATTVAFTVSEGRLVAELHTPLMVPDSTISLLIVAPFELWEATIAGQSDEVLFEARLIVQPASTDDPDDTSGGLLFDGLLLPHNDNGTPTS